MNTTLQPIEHRDVYTREVEREINAWFAEAIFAPIFIILTDAGVPVDPRNQAIRFDEFGRANGAGGWVEYPAEWGGLGLERKDLPQIPPDSRGALLQFLEAREITATEEWIRPDELRPSQNGYYQDAVDRARELDKGDRAVLVSADGYVMDGHHRWTAARLDRPDEPIRCLRFNATIWPLIRNAKQLPTSTRENAATSAIEEALRAGTVHYSEGVFSGRFSAALTRELRAVGATFDAGAKTFRISQASIPLELRGILSDAAQRSADVTKGVVGILRAIEENVGTAAVGLTFKTALERITNDLGRQFITTTQQMGPKDVALAPDIDATTRAAISEGFTNNLNLSIKKFSVERIPELRRRVEENAFKFGGRTDRLAKIIEAEFGVARRKAEFLADQETGLLVSKYRAEKYGQLGITDYTWSTSMDSRVRPSHRRLQGKRFSFSTGALVSEPGQPARYCNPGEDYRCRCVPRPIVNLDELAA